MTTTKTTISISEARKNIFEIADAVQKSGVVYTLTSDGKPKVVVMSAEEYESMTETMEILYDFPDIKKDIADTKQAVKTGEYKRWPTLDDLRHDWGMARMVAEKPKRKYGIHSHHKTKGKKKSR